MKLRCTPKKEILEKRRRNMSIQLSIYDLVVLLLFSLQYIQVTRSETELDTWINAVSDCNKKNVYLESNETIIKNYITTHDDVRSLWVGRFDALLPWIEIRGCYNILQTCNSKEKDEKVAKNSALCQLKCMKRQYFAFNQNNERCVCFDENGIVMQPSENSSLCRMCKGRSDCNSFAVTYKVVDRSISDDKNENDACLSYRCYRGKPIFSESDCYDLYCKPYCRNIQRAVASKSLPFYDHLKACEEHHFSYPLLISENSVQLCDIPESDGTDNWVGVYRQALSADYLDTTVQQFYNQHFKNITKCYYLLPDGSFMDTKDCGDEQLHHYICTEDDSMNDLENPYNSSPSTPVCHNEGPDIPDVNNQSSGLIVGIVMAILVIVSLIVIVVLMYRRRINPKSPNLKDKCCDKDQRNSDNTAREKNSDGQYHELGLAVGPYSFAKPLADTNSYGANTTEDDNSYSRIVSGAFDSSNIPKKTMHATTNPGYSDHATKVDVKTFQTRNQQNSKSADYCLAKPITDQTEQDPYTDNADYDHLTNIKKGEENTINVYDHVPNIIDSDDTYDHSTINICKSDANNYDHFDVQN